MAQTVKRLPAMWETWVRFPGREDPLEKEMATHSSILARKIPWMEEPGGLQSMESQRVRHNRATSFIHSQKACPQAPVLGIMVLRSELVGVGLGDTGAPSTPRCPEA